MTTQSDSFFETLCECYEECYQHLHDAAKLLQRFEGVEGIGIGPKSSANVLMPGQPCFLVYVREKKSRTELDAKELIPREVLGVMTDVVAIGSRASAAHTEFDARWLKWSQEGFFSITGDGCRQAS